VSIVVDITEISAIAAAAGVLVGVVYYVLEMRHQTRLREMDLIMRVDDKYADRIEQCWQVIRKNEFKNLDDYEEKCPLEAAQVAGFFDGLGLLLRRGLADIDLISGLFLMEPYWQKMKPFVEGVREKLKDPRAYINFEYLYNRWKKREQKFRSKGA
jgi:hypothetical protein